MSQGDEFIVFIVDIHSNVLSARFLKQTQNVMWALLQK
jgi:selenocysteine lyase/cysteine desulfurase